MNTDTICAVSTPAGIGGIAVIRVSGKDAIRITDSLFKGRNRLQDSEGGRIHYGVFGKEEDIDEVLVSVFRAPHSFTGEDVVEISCHGSLYIQQDILSLLLRAGCRMAEAGEFTRRAFLNGKMDLSEAEAVADLIASENAAQHKLALNHLRGGISDDLARLREQLLHFTSLLELELDFADHEELEFADRTELRQLAEQIRAHLQNLLESFRLGNAVKNGIAVAIIGPVNAGKSTLLNALVGEERAIVSSQAGTTRDTVEDSVTIDGIRFRFIDTAGIRETTNEIESIGIHRSMDAAAKADIILLVLDSTADTSMGKQLLQGVDTSGKTILTLLNKCDLLKEGPASTDNNTIYISAKQNRLERLKERLKETAEAYRITEGVVISNLRHRDALARALDAIIRVEEGMQNQLSGELITMDLHDCLNALGEITGAITSQEVLNNIFSRFCIGK